jgi:hypothetical protein
MFLGDHVGRTLWKSCEHKYACDQPNRKSPSPLHLVASSNIEMYMAAMNKETTLNQERVVWNEVPGGEKSLFRPHYL